MAAWLWGLPKGTAVMNRKIRKKVTRVWIKYDPIVKSMEIQINGENITNDDFVVSAQGKDINKWLMKFPAFLYKIGADRLSITFCGTEADWRRFERKVKMPSAYQKLNKPTIRFKPGISYGDYLENIRKDMLNLEERLLLGENSAELAEMYAEHRHLQLRIDVIATMSSGKSTVINALLGQKLLPSGNEACTATIMEILDTDANDCRVKVFDDKNEGIYEKQYSDNSDLDVAALAVLNQNADVKKIRIERDIPFVDAKGTALMLVDTPGANNAVDKQHRDTTLNEYKKICGDSNNIVLYVLNGTQIGTNDDSELLNYISKRFEEQGESAESRILFVLNKMDMFNPDEENVADTIANVRKYLKNHGITHPRVFVCSARIALQLKTNLKQADLANLSREEEKRLPQEARETLPAIENMIAYGSMHLEKYATVPVAITQEVDAQLKDAEQKHDIWMQALIHSGFLSLENYISMYLKAKTIRNTMDFLDKSLERLGM